MGVWGVGDKSQICAPSLFHPPTLKLQIGHFEKLNTYFSDNYFRILIGSHIDLESNLGRWYC